MSANELRRRLYAAAARLTGAMDDPDVAHRLRLLEPGIAQIEATIDGLESKVAAVAEHRAGSQVVVAAASGKRRKQPH